jgi:hypothetical protein
VGKNPEKIKEFKVPAFSLDKRKLDTMQVTHLFPEALNILIGDCHAPYHRISGGFDMTRDRACGCANVPG